MMAAPHAVGGDYLGGVHRLGLLSSPRCASHSFTTAVLGADPTSPAHGGRDRFERKGHALETADDPIEALKHGDEVIESFGLLRQDCLVEGERRVGTGP